MVPQSQRGQVPIRRHRWILILGAMGGLLILGMIWVVLQRGGRDSLEESLTAAQAALADGDDVAAVDGFSQVLEGDPDNVVALEGQLEAAERLAQVGQSDAAIVAYEAVWQKKPTEARALRGLARIYETGGDWRAAAGWYEKWTQVMPKDIDAFLALGEARFYLGEYEHAVAAYERARSLGTVDVAANEHLGLAYYELARYDEAGQWLQRFVSQGVGGESPDVFYALGEVYFEREEYERAVSFYERALELDPERTAALAEQASANLDRALYAVQGILLDLGFSNVVSEGDDAYAIAKMGQMVKIEGAVQLVDGPWGGSRALVVEEGTTNNLANPSVEIGASGWDFYDDSPYISRSNDRAYKGNYSIKVSGTNNTGSIRTPAGRSSLVVASVDQVWTASAYVWLDSTNQANPRLSIEFLDGTGSRISASSVEANLTKTNEWQRVSLSDTAAPNTAYVRVLSPFLEIEDNIVILVYYDAIQLEQKPYATTYCDGAQSNSCQWSKDGIPHNSTSTRASTFVSIPSAGIVNGPTGSISVWWRPGHASNVDYHRYLFDLRDGSTDWGYLYWDFNKDRYSFSGLLSDIQTFLAGEWQHVVITWESGSRQIYVNGVLENSDSASQPSSIPNTLYLGARYSGEFNINGSMAKFVTYDRVLTAAEVMALYRTGISIPR